MRALMVAVFQMARDETEVATKQDVQISLRSVREMTKIAEREIHAIVLSCARARRQMLAMLPPRNRRCIDQMPLTSQARRARDSIFKSFLISKP
jgi:hypothetical protein